MVRNRKIVPWSECDERTLRLVLWLDFYSFVTLLVVAIAMAIFHAWPPSLICFAGAFAFSVDLCIQGSKYQYMMLNRPRSTENLTAWVQLRPWQTELCCACGRMIDVDAAKWYPNEIDPGGGRFSIVCPCGIGYFKLREAKTVTRVS